MGSTPKLFVSLLVAVLMASFAQGAYAAPIAGETEGVGREFSITDSLGQTYTISSTAEIRLSAQAVAADNDMSLDIQLYSVDASNATILTIDGFTPGRTYFLDLDGETRPTIQADSLGTLSVPVATGAPTTILIKTRPSTVYIGDAYYWPYQNDCATVGTWTSTILYAGICKLNSNVSDSIYLQTNTILDGDGYAVDTGHKPYGVQLANGKTNSTITNLTIKNSNKCISLESSNNNITVDSVTMQNCSFGVWMGYNTAANVANNWIGDGSAVGIFTQNNDTALLSFFSNNQISAPLTTGFKISGAMGNTLTGNVVSGVAQGTPIPTATTGILIYNASKNILASNIVNGFNKGVFLDSSEEQVFTDNTISNNRYGVDMPKYKNNLNGPVYHSFINNYFNNLTNVVNSYSTYPSFPGNIQATWNLLKKADGENIIGGPFRGGNYWANPNGSGYSQTCVDEVHTDNNNILVLKDGICDTPYIVLNTQVPNLALVEDNFPLTDYSGTPANSPPLLSQIGEQALRAGETLTFFVAATDPDPGDTLTFSAGVAGSAPYPTGATFDTTSKEFSWTPSLSNENNTYTVRFTVTDSGNPAGTDYEDVDITVVPNQPPLFELSPETGLDVDEGQWIKFTLKVSDPDGIDGTVNHATTLPNGSMSPLPPNALFYFQSPTNTYKFDWLTQSGEAGTYTVKFTAKDSWPPSPAEANLPVGLIVRDKTPPTITGVPANQTMEATSPGGAEFAFTLPTATDVVDGSCPVNCTPASGSTFAIGTTIVTCSASDTIGNTASRSFTVTVLSPDTTPPNVTGVPANITKEASGPGGATVTFALPTATDDVDGTVAVTCNPSSGSTFAIGTTTVSCSATDAHHNMAGASFTVTVQDTTAPVITVPSDVTSEATATLTPVAIGTATATDAVGVVTISSSAPATFPVGTTIVTWTAADAAGNTAYATQNVNVTDSTPPTIAGVPADITMEATGPDGAAVTFTLPTATDLVDGTVSVTCTPGSGTTFPIGGTSPTITTVACSATDSHGNTRNASFTVSITDITPPTITELPTGILEPVATTPSGAIVTFNPAATDIVANQVGVSCIPESGSIFPAATPTTVNCTATDTCGNTAKAFFTVATKYNWTGFFKPVDNPGNDPARPVVNVAKAGSAIPVKFSLGGDMGLQIFAVQPGVYPITTTGAIEELIEETVTAGASSLSYDPASNQYTYVWKTSKSWVGKSYQLRFRLKDGTDHYANFSFK